jgi:hypothetical protein
MTLASDKDFQIALLTITDEIAFMSAFMFAHSLMLPARQDSVSSSTNGSCKQTPGTPAVPYIILADTPSAANEKSPIKLNFTPADLFVSGF